MTILIVSFTPKEILFASDTFRYQLTENISDAILAHTLEIDNHNLSDHVESYETDCPKIHKITRNIGLICGGDGRFSDIPEGLNKRKNIAKQIIERLQQKGKIKAFWSCHIGRLHNGKITLTSIIYESGKITINKHTKEAVSFDSFAPEMKKRFPFMVFYIANTQEKIAIVNEFFEHTTKLYNGLAGGRPQIALLNEKGFQWIHPHDFTGYSLNWCPERLETMLATDLAWSQETYTDVLELGFECESTMLCIILANAKSSLLKDTGTGSTNSQYKLLLDGNVINGTYGWIGKEVLEAGEALRGVYSTHTVAIVTKGSHALKMQMCGDVGSTVHVYDRRLTIIKGFYQGGTT